MTDKQQPEALRQAAWLKKEGASCQRHYDLGVLIERQHAELETLTLYKSLADEYGLSIFKDLKDLTTEIENLREKLKTYEDLGDAADDMQLLRMGYAAARLEIESLKAQPAAQQPGAAYAALPESLILAVDRWFSANTGLGGCSDKDVRELAELFYAVTHAGGRESVDDALAIVESFGPGISGINDTYARQILLAEEVKRLRASHGQAPASTSGDFIRRTNEDYAAWCATKYTPEFNSKGPDLHGLWAWQEQQRRMDDLLRQAPINLNCKSEQKRLATLWGFVPAQAAPAAVAGPAAVLKFERGTPGRQNEMPRVVSCNWMPDGEYEVYLAAAPTPAAQAAASVLEDAARYRLVRRGQHWSVINGIANGLRAEELDAAIDAARAAQEGK